MKTRKTFGLQFCDSCETPLTTNCNLKSHHVFFFSQLDLVLKSDGGDLSNFITNGEWYLLGKLYSYIWYLLLL